MKYSVKQRLMLYNAFEDGDGDQIRSGIGILIMAPFCFSIIYLLPVKKHIAAKF